MTTESPMLTYQQAAALMNIPVGTLYGMVFKKQIPHVRLGKRFVRFRQEDLNDWITERQVAVTP